MRPPETLVDTMRETELATGRKIGDVLLEAYMIAEGNGSKTAELLGRPRSVLYRWFAAWSPTLTLDELADYELKAIQRGHYTGKRGENGLNVTFWGGVDRQELPPRLDLRSHSPTGFECGYLGSGPSQLALAILAHATGDDHFACRRYHDFKAMVIANIPGPAAWRDDPKRGKFILSKDEVLAWVAEHPLDDAELDRP